MKMKVVFICIHDWANECYTISKALNKVGVEAKTFTRKLTSIDYPEKGIVFSVVKKIRKFVKEADIVIFGFSEFIETDVNLTKKVVGVLHGGSKYRQYFKKLNKQFNKIVDITLSGSDMCGLGAKNEVCVFSAVDDEFLKPTYKNFDISKKIIVGHYPSGNKGYDIIYPVIEKLQKEIDFEFRYSSESVPFKKQVSRVSEVDIYIENLRDNQQGKKLTTFGRTCLEAASLGKIVCTRFLDIDLYRQMFGESAIQMCNTGEELESKLRYLLQLSERDFLNLQKSSRDWIEKYHGLVSMGEKWKQILETALLEKRQALLK